MNVELPPPILIDAVDAGRLLRLSRSKVLAMARQHYLPHVHVGRMVRYSPEALREWARRQAIDSG